MADPGDTRGSSTRTWGVSRFLAPLALVAVLIAVVVIVNGSLGDEASTDVAANRTETTTSDTKASDEKEGPENPKTYTVESGDVLSSIAETFGVSVERLQRLNPDVDPNTLNAGTEITIR